MQKILCSTGAIIRKIKGSGYEGDYTLEASSYDSDGNVDTELLNKQFAYVREYI